MLIQLQAYWRPNSGNKPVLVASTDVEHCSDSQDIRDFRAKATALAKDGTDLTFYMVTALNPAGFDIEEITNLDEIIEAVEIEEAEERALERHYATKPVAGAALSLRSEP
jgi:hypothetical protein